mgnify:CR=1 FL=1
MTAKEEAIELVEKYLKKIIELAYAETKTKELAKQCALICVDEKGKSIIWSSDFNGDKRIRLEEVKKEINKL